MPFLAHHIYPLKHPERFDDELGAGFDHALLADRGPIPAGGWVHDAWIVTREGDLHPGLNSSPVPVRLEDVHENRGHPFRQATR